LGLTRYGEAELLGLLTAAGFDGRRRRRNFGANQRRMTFIATPR
jgi:hypothetical protein